MPCECEEAGFTSGGPKWLSFIHFKAEDWITVIRETYAMCSIILYQPIIIINVISDQAINKS